MHPSSTTMLGSTGSRLMLVPSLQAPSAGLSRHRWLLYHKLLHTNSPQKSAAVGQDAIIPISAIPPLAPTPTTPSYPNRLSRRTDSSPSSTLSSISSTSHLSTSLLLKTWLLTLFTSTPLILGPSINILSAIAHSPPTSYLSPDRNPILRWILKKTIYSHFCAGENAIEVGRTIENLRRSGIGGLILCYAKEVETRGDEAAAIPTEAKQTATETAEVEINSWADGVMKTLELVPAEGFVSIKLSGAGTQTLHHLKYNLPPPPLLSAHLQKICTSATDKRVSLCIDAEQSTIQAGINNWTVDLMRQHNKTRACIYNTYQSYLVSSPATLGEHLLLASREQWVLGVKLVRGAYLASEDRKLFWPSKQATDRNFDLLASTLIRQEWGDSIVPPCAQQQRMEQEHETEFPNVALILATHNLESCQKALVLHREQQEPEPESTPGSKKRGKIRLTYAQLQGMADHVTGEILSSLGTTTSTSSTSIAAAATPSTPTTTNRPVSQPGEPEAEAEAQNKAAVPVVAKYLTWGTVSECSKYLVRRAEENRDAVARNVDARRVLGREVLRRMGVWFGLV